MNPDSSQGPAFLFDLDGTLVSFSPAYSQRYAGIVRKTFTSFGIVPEEDFIRRIELFGDFEAVNNLIGPERAKLFWFRIEQADFELRKEMMCTGDIRLAEQAHDVLTSISAMGRRGLPLSLVSNTNPSSAFWQLWHFDLLRHFRFIYLLNWNFSQPKPDPEGFLSCLSHYGSLGSVPVIYVGDSTSDVTMVQNAIEAQSNLWAKVVKIQNGQGAFETPKEFEQRISKLSELPARVSSIISEWDSA